MHASKINPNNLTTQAVVFQEAVLALLKQSQPPENGNHRGIEE